MDQNDVRIQNFFLAFVIPPQLRAPQQDEYEQVAASTLTYFSDVLEMEYQDNPDIEFVRMVYSLNNTREDLGIPEQRYNV